MAEIYQPRQKLQALDKVRLEMQLKDKLIKDAIEGQTNKNAGISPLKS